MISISLLLFSLLACSSLFAYAPSKVVFTNREAAFVLNNQARIAVGPEDSLLGWKDGSIVKRVEGVGEGDFNLRQQTSLHGTKYEATTASAGGGLVYSNSNTICSIQTVSYGLMLNNSNAIIKLSRTASDLQQLVRHNSNALEYRYRTMSNAVNYLVGIEETPLVVDTDTSIENIRFIKNGFAIADDTTLTINTPLSLAGGMNFGENAILNLNGDLTLSSNAYFVNDTHLIGQNRKLTLQNSVIFNNALRLTGGLVIDGCGNDVFINNHVLLDNFASVTFRNMNMHVVEDAYFSAGEESHLTLQNVQVKLHDDCSFTQGYVHIVDDVIVRGKGHSLAYISPKPLIVHPGALLKFEVDTTFILGPSTPASRYIMRMIDPTSLLYFNGSTFEASIDGAHITHGTVLFDNRVHVINKDGVGDNNTDPSKAITFETQSNGAAYVHLLAGARVEVDGYVDFPEIF